MKCSIHGIEKREYLGFTSRDWICDLCEPVRSPCAAVSVDFSTEGATAQWTFKPLMSKGVRTIIAQGRLSAGQAVMYNTPAQQGNYMPRMLMTHAGRSLQLTYTPAAKSAGGITDAELERIGDQIDDDILAYYVDPNYLHGGGEISVDVRHWTAQLIDSPSGVQVGARVSFMGRR